MDLFVLHVINDSNYTTIVGVYTSEAAAEDAMRESMHRHKNIVPMNSSLAYTIDQVWVNNVRLDD